MSDPPPVVAACDIAICGGGMVGATLALALAPLPLSIAIIEAAEPGSASPAAQEPPSAGTARSDAPPAAEPRHALSREALQRLEGALRDLTECRRLLD